MVNYAGRSTQAILSRAHSTPADQCKFLFKLEYEEDEDSTLFDFLL